MNEHKNNTHLKDDKQTPSKDPDVKSDEMKVTEKPVTPHTK